MATTKEVTSYDVWRPATLLGRQRMALQPHGSMELPVITRLENGSTVVKRVDASTMVLPSVDVTDLKMCLDAGVDLKQVNSKVLGIRGDVEISTVDPNPQTNNNEGDN